MPSHRPSVRFCLLCLLLCALIGNSPPAQAQAEVCDGRDSDADGTIDEGCPSQCLDPRARSLEQVGSTAGWQADLGRDRSLVWDGRGFAGVWVESSGFDTRVVFRRFGPQGVPLATPLVLSDLAPIDDRPAIAWSGSGYGVAWSSEDFGLPQIYFASLDSDGILTAGPVLVNTVDEDGQRPSIFWDGGGFTVAWAWYNARLHARRIDAGGQPLTAEVCLNCDGPSGTGDISSCRGGSLLGFAYSDAGGGVRFLRTDTALARVGGVTNLTLVTGAGRPSLACRSGEFALAWYDRRDVDDGIFFNRIDPAGTILGTDLRVNGTERYGSNPSIVWSGQEYLVAWAGGDGPGYSVLLRRLDAVGTPLAASRSFAAGDGPYARPSLVWTGSRPAWLRDEDQLSFPRPVSLRLLDCCADADLDGSGWCDGDEDDGDDAVHPGGVELCDGKDNDQDGSLDEGCDGVCEGARLTAVDDLATQPPLPPAVATGRGAAPAFVVHADGLLPGIQLTVERGGPPWAASPVESDPSDSLDPAVAWSGRRLGCVFDDRRDGHSTLRWTSLDGDGTTTVADRALGPGADSGARPDLAWDGRRFSLVHLAGADRIPSFTVVTESGAPLLGALPLAAAGTGSAAQVVNSPAWGGGSAVAWLAPEAGGTSVWIELRDADGGRLAGPTQVAGPAGGRGNLALGRSGEGYLLAWTEPAGATEELVGAAVDRALSPISAPQPLTSAGGLPRDPELVFTGSETVLLFTDERDGGQRRLFRLRLDPLSNALGPVVPVGSDRQVGPPAAAWDGTAIRLGWTVPSPGGELVRTGTLDCGGSLRPPAVRRLRLPDPSTLDWDPVEAATYDVVSGDLTLLAASGSLADATDTCEATGLVQPSFQPPARALPAFYLVRAVSFGSRGTWNADEPAPPAERDAAIDASAGACP